MRTSIATTADIILVSRKSRGVGGMQRYCLDLHRALVERSLRVKRIQPLSRAALGLLPMLLFLQHRHAVRIHLCDASLVLLGYLLKCWVPTAKITVTAHGLDVVYPAPWYQFLLRRCLPALDGVIAVSRATAAMLHQRGIPKEHIHVIPCGIWTTSNTAFTPSSQPRLITVGRLIPRKGVAWFVEHVLPMLVKSHPNLLYQIVGSGPERTNIMAAARRSGVSAHVAVMGAVSDTERDELLRQADVYIQPNIDHVGDMEGFGISCIEASSRGVPVVAAKLQGLTDAVIDEQTGVLFATGDSQACRIAVEQMLSQPLSRERVAAATLHRFAWSKLVHHYCDHVFA